MSEPVDPGRRRLLGLLVSTGLAGIFSSTFGRPGLGGPLDQGIGGTGAAPPRDDGNGDADRGIGGTGVIGTIKKFGSIYVNDLRISYPQSAEVTIDGRRAALSDLKLGQVVRVDARGTDDALSTERISVNHEVVGPVEARGPNRLTVLGQTVSTEELPPRTWMIGDTVAVSGLRRNDGTIVASLVEPRPGAAPRVSGPLERVPGGGLRIGALAIDRVSPTLIGKRATLEGDVRRGSFVVTRGTSEASPFPKDVRRLSIESYVERRDGTLSLGSGFAVAGGGGLDIAQGRSVRAVIATTVAADGRLEVESLREGGRTYRVPGGSGGGHEPGGRGPGGRGPGGRGPGGHGPGGHGPAGRGSGGRGSGGRGSGGRGADGGRGREPGGHAGGGKRGGASQHGGGDPGRGDPGRGGPGHGGPGHGGPDGRGGFGSRGEGPGSRGFGGPGGPRGFEGPGGFGGPRGFGPGGPRGPGGFGPGGPRGSGGFGPGGPRGPGGFHGGGFRGGGFRRGGPR